jgi:hypothetical protein
VLQRLIDRSTRPSSRLGFALLAVIATTAVAPAVASADSRVGVPSSGIVSRAFVDTYMNFSIRDVSNAVPAGGGGYISTFEYYAQHTGTIALLVTDSSGTVIYISPNIPVTSTGAQTYTPSTPIDVVPGDEIGYYSAGTGVIPFDNGGGTYAQTNNNTGKPTVGQTIGNFTVTRTYSLGANVIAHPTSTTVSCSPSSVSVGLTTTCTATVTDNAPPAVRSTPTGTVSFSRTGATGTFSPTSCTLVAASPSSATCSVSFAPSGSGTAAITARYNGDVTHAPSTAAGSSAGTTTVSTTGCTPGSAGPHCGRVSSATATVRAVRVVRKHHGRHHVAHRAKRARIAS